MTAERTHVSVKLQSSHTFVVLCTTGGFWCNLRRVHICSKSMDWGWGRGKCQVTRHWRWWEEVDRWRRAPRRTAEYENFDPCLRATLLLRCKTPAAQREKEKKNTNHIIVVNKIVSISFFHSVKLLDSSRSTPFFFFLNPSPRILYLWRACTSQNPSHDHQIQAKNVGNILKQTCVHRLSSGCLFADHDRRVNAVETNTHKE